MLPFKSFKENLLICGAVVQPCRKYSQYTRNALIGGEQLGHVIKSLPLQQNYEDWIKKTDKSSGTVRCHKWSKNPYGLSYKNR